MDKGFAHTCGVRADLDLFPDLDLGCGDVQLVASDERVIIFAKRVEGELVPEVNGSGPHIW